ncbi:restriction endonuclease S subunits-like protein [Burkholderia sp. YI23]|nr:restriction endonuclease S subunits-like protein [Burkholderia sp. YI23]
MGIIPDEWQVSTVGREFDVKLGKMLDAEKNVGDLKPYIGNRNVRWDSIDARELPLMRMTRSDMDRFRLKKGDLLACEGGEVGRAAIWAAPIEECYYQKALHRLRPLRGFDSRLMVGLLRLWSERGTLGNYVTQTSIAHLPREKFVDIPMPVPPQPEQTSIATALSDVDELLSGLDKLIAKKRDLKQAAMQQLLTGKTRLPGFDGVWCTKKFGEFVSIRNQKVMPTQVDPETLCIELEHIDQGNGRLLAQGNASDSSASKYRFREGDILFGRLRSYLRKYWRASENGICTTEIWPLMFDNDLVNAGYVFALVQTNAFIEAASVSYGTHMPRADWGVVRNFPVALPPLDEQAAIGEFLSDIEVELTALEAQREKTRLLKQGMMQELLTGKTRLV